MFSCRCRVSAHPTAPLSQRRMGRQLIAPCQALTVAVLGMTAATTASRIARRRADPERDWPLSWFVNPQSHRRIVECFSQAKPMLWEYE